MTRKLRVTLFGGQGHKALFSKKAAEDMIEKAKSSTIPSLLLSRCHAAFLVEVESAKGAAPEEARSAIDDLTGLLAPEDLINPTGLHDNPVMHGSTLLLHQLLEHLVSVLPQEATLESELPQLSDEVVGFCSGVLPAIVVCCAATVEEYLHYAEQAIRLAFWIGYRQVEFCANEEGEDWLDRGAWATVLSKRDLDVDWVKRKIHEFNTGDAKASAPDRVSTPTADTVRLSATNNASSVSLVGAPGPLQEFREFIGDTIYGDSLSAEPIPIRGLYHGGERAMPILEKTLEDVRRRSIDLPTAAELKRPLRSSANGELLFGDDKKAALVEMALKNIFVDAVDWRPSWKAITQMGAELGAHVEVKARGPVAPSLLPLPPPNDVAFQKVQVSLNEQYERDKAHHQAYNDPNSVAIVGMSVNFPIGENKDAFWSALETGLNSIEEISKARIDIARYLDQASPAHAKYGNFINRPWQFDHQYFDMSPREVKSMDPQQRLLLQSAVHALEDAGYTPDVTPSYQRSSFGCYVGVATNDYVDHLRNDIDVYYSTGTLNAFLSGKLSYAFKWEGPSIVVNTACSSSLVAIYQACRALRSGDCTAAIAGGVNTITSGDMYQGLFRAHFLSPTGQCKAFDASADGYCRSEGCGLFVLKRLKDAVAENDRIYGVIRGVEVNQCGNAQSITHPRQETQQALFRKILTSTSIPPSSVGVVEAHGTGTKAGDAAEISSIQAVFGRPPNESHPPLYLTAVKSNTGHAEAASGAAGLAKLLLMLREGKVPPQVGVKNFNPKLVEAMSHGINITRTNRDWATGLAPRRALLNNFGAAGSNAALLVEEHVPPPRTGVVRTAYPFVISARSEVALTQLCKEYQSLLSRAQVPPLRDICYTATARRQRHPHIIATSCTSTADLAKKLNAASRTSLKPIDGPVIFTFSGQGAIYSGMGRELLTSSVFAEAVHYCESLLKRWSFPSVLPMIEGSATPHSDPIIAGQCACFVLEYALSQLVRSWSIVPNLVIGHSLGEYAAMVDAGMLSVENGLWIVANRALLMRDRCSVGQTSMLTCNQPSTAIQGLIASNLELSDLTIACYNSPNDCVLSGPLEQLERFQKLCSQSGWRYKLLQVPFGFHSAALDPIVAPLEQLCSAIKTKEPQIPIGSNYHGRMFQSNDLHASYFANQARHQVRYLEMLKSIPASYLNGATFIEIGPAGITLPMLRNTFGDGIFLPLLSPKENAWVTLSSALSSLSTRSDIDWRNVFDGSGACIVDLPQYPFASTDLQVPFSGRGIEHHGETKPLAFGLQITTDPNVFSTQLSSLSQYIDGHRVGGTGICPASVYHSMVFEGAFTILDPEPHETLIIKDVEFDKPLVYETSQAEDVLLFSLDSARSAHGRQGFRFSSQHQPIVSYCSGQLAKETVASVQNELSRIAAFLKRQRSHLSQIPDSRLDSFTTRILYNTIFPRVVEYSAAYHSIAKLTALDDGSEGFGAFKMPPSEDEMLLRPEFVDTLLHAAGFIANSHVASNEICICTKVESIKVLHGEVLKHKEFSLYCSLLHCIEGTILAESYALTEDGEVIAAVEGMHFKRLQLRSFQSHVSRSLKKRTTSKASTITKPLQMPVAAPMMQPLVAQPSDQAVIDILSKVFELVPEDIKPHDTLSSLGCDSLTGIELADKIMQQFSDLSLDHSSIQVHWTVEEFQATILGPEAVKAQVTVASGIPASLEQPIDDYVAVEVTNLDSALGVETILGKVCGVPGSALGSMRTLEGLGVDSLLSIELIEAIKDTYDVQLCESVFTKDLTVGDLGRLVFQSIATTTPGLSRCPTVRIDDIERGSMSKLQHLDDTVPLFLFHDGSGTTGMYKGLQCLDRDVYAIANGRLSDEQHWATAIDEMASVYASMIANTPHDSVILAGWSFGGVLAHEVARQLAPMGKYVHGIILIDSPCPKDHTPLPDAVIDHVTRSSRLVSYAGSNSLRWVTNQFRTHARFLSEYVFLPLAGTSRYVMLLSQDPFDASGLCQTPYKWLEDIETHKETVNGWEQLTGMSIEVFPIPGTHFEPFKPKNVGTVSMQLKAACNRILDSGKQISNH